MVCGLDFDYPEWFYKASMYIAALGILIFIVFMFIYSSASGAEEPNNALIKASLWLLISGAIMIVPAIIVYFTRSSNY